MKNRERDDQQVVPLTMSMNAILDKIGNQFMTTADWIVAHLAKGWEHRYYASMLTVGGNIRVNDELVGDRGITYDFPYNEVSQEIVITANGQARLLIQDEPSGIDTLITDEDLRRVEFLPDGRVEIKD